MKWTRADIEDCVRQISWPPPSADLRQRVLSAASVIGSPITWSDRLWFSRPLRLSAAAAVLAIVAIDGLSSSSAFRLTPAPHASAEARVVDEVGLQVGLPPSVAAALARRTVTDGIGRARAEQVWLSRGDAALQGQQ